MTAADFTFLLKPKQKFRYNAGPYDRERNTPAYTIEISAPSHVGHLLVINQALIKTADGFLWVWDIENRSDSLLPPFFTVKKDGQPVRRLEHMVRVTNTAVQVILFFRKSSFLDSEILRPLSHILPDWELTWDANTQQYCEEHGSYAAVLNLLISELQAASPPTRYHDSEDRLAEYVVKNLKWPIHKKGKRWVGAHYPSIIKQGGFDDLDQQDLVLAAAGRIRAAIERGQIHYDDMEESHRWMLGAVLSIILYHRTPPDD